MFNRLIQTYLVNIYNVKKIQLFLLLLFTALCVFLTLNKHSRSGIFNYTSEIYTDKAGYYVYLPALFIYDFEADKLPDSIVLKTGNGFELDTKNTNTIRTKYSCGVAILQAPFFLINHGIAKLFNLDQSGFSISYHKAIDIASVFYLVLGLVFLYHFLNKHVSSRATYITLFSFFLGTNLFFYSIDDTGMSHIYSFFLFSVYLFLADTIFQKTHHFTNYLLFGLITGLIIVVRPMNIIFLPVFFIVQKNYNSGFFKNLYNTPFRYYILCFITICITLLPQLLYWKYVSGSFFHYSYTKEGFTNLLSPKLILFWFSTNNGLFIYSPLFLFSLLGLYIMRKEKKIFAILTFLYFIGISYLFASWWCWHYGCGYGSRTFVEYYALFSLPFAYLVDKWWSDKVLRAVLFTSIGLLILLNLKLSYSVDNCWYGGDWDWHEYFTLLKK